MRTQADGNHVRLSLADNGCGIPAENLPRIFEPLFTTKNFGVGLGLSMVKEIVEIHGGSVAVTSTVNAGTTLTLAIPQRSAGEVVLFDDEPEPRLRRRPPRNQRCVRLARSQRRDAAAWRWHVSPPPIVHILGRHVEDAAQEASEIRPPCRVSSAFLEYSTGFAVCQGCRKLITPAAWIALQSTG